ncbi:MAG: hypothetical protein KDB68_10225 [Planctomycetes bacterium]|nr:hypothetical protein [Planctomycetota bacterium]
MSFRRTKLIGVAALLVLAGCATTGGKAAGVMQLEDSAVVMPVRNLAGVPLKVPAVYFGDAVGKGAELDVGEIDLRLLAEAAVYAHLSELGYDVAFDQNAESLKTPPKYEIHAAITQLDMTHVRRTGRFTMGMTVMLVDAPGQFEVARGSAEREFQLLDIAPDEAGAIGEERFIETRLQTFTEGLAREAIDSAGF